MPLTRASSVCALIPHFECHDWLAGAIESLLAQTRPLDAIVVIDDASAEPPIDVVAAYPSVTLLVASDNAGPYRLVQTVIDQTQFDAYLFQDADDWSSPDRLELLLAEAERSGAELVGSHEVRVLVDEPGMQPVKYPLDVNKSLFARPSSFPLLHPTSLVGRSLVQRLGGFATGLRFSGDAEFLRRAGHAARVVNVDAFAYFRRKRAGSLTTATDTALTSPARLALRAELAARAEDNAGRLRRGQPLDLAPLRTAPPAALEHMLGPSIHDGAPRDKTTAVAAPAARQPVGGGPAFLVGAPRSGLDVLAWCMAQHTNLDLLVDGEWFALLVAALAHAADGCPTGPDRFHGAAASALDAVTGRGPEARLLVAHPELSFVIPALRSLWPDARFVHLVRGGEDVRDSLVQSPTEEGVFFTAASAAEYWLATNRAVCAVATTVGPDALLRVSYNELFDRPEEAVRRVLAFLGEPDSPACLRPLKGMPVPAGRDEPVLPDVGVESGTGGAPRHSLLSRRPCSMVDNVRCLVDACVPPQAVVVVASKGDPELVDLGSRESWHFPQVDGGVYAGHHPADGGEAVHELENLVEGGAEFFLIPASGLWWLDYYEALDEWLSRTCRLVGYQEDAGAVWRLGAQPDAPAAAVRIPEVVRP